MTTNELFYWDMAKFAIPFLIALAAWAWRVEIRLSNQSLLITKITETLDRFGNILDDWNDARSGLTERIARIEAKLDFMASRGRTL